MINEYGHGEKHLVVPGYVFVPQYTPGTVQVPEDEWKIIETISDPQPSIFDHANRTFTEGPLKMVEVNITDVEEDRIRACVKLLGQDRWYWLAVTPLDPDVASAYRRTIPEEGRDLHFAESPVWVLDEKGRSMVVEDRKKKEKPLFTEEQEAQMLARAEEIGTVKAAEEFSVPWQVIAGMKRRARGKSAGEIVPEAKKGELTKKPGRKKKGIKKDAESLKAENAELRERFAKLEAQLKKLKRALLELL